MTHDELMLAFQNMGTFQDQIGLSPAGLSELKESQAEAYLADRVGTVQNPACNRCQTTAGPLLRCSIAPKVNGELLFGNACTGCHYSDLDDGCSFHESFRRIGSEDTWSLVFGSDHASTASTASSPIQRRRTRGVRRAVYARGINKREPRKVQQRGGFDFEEEIKRVVIRSGRTLELDEGALQGMIDFMNDMFTQIAEEAGRIAFKEKKAILDKHGIKTAFRLVLGLNNPERWNFVWGRIRNYGSFED